MSEYETIDAVRKLGELDPEYAEHLKANGPANPPWHDLSKMRSRPKRETPAAATVISIAMRDGHQNEALVFKPASSAAEKTPLVLLIPGGGFVTGAKEDMAPLAERILDKFGATVVCLSYRLAPENKFPTPPNDVWDAFCWTATNAASLGANPKAGFIVGGVSSGGNLAAVTAQKAADTQFSPPLTGVYVSMAVLLHAHVVPEEHRSLWVSREQNASASGINAEGMKYVADYYGYDKNSPLYSPFNSPTAHTSLPPVYIQVAGGDPLRDDCLVYERALRGHGVKTKLDVYPGVPHRFAQVIPKLTISQKYHRDAMAGFSWLLGKS